MPPDVTPIVSPSLVELPFDEDIRNLTEGFTGREWVFEKIDHWLYKSQETFFLLTGETGVGKSAVAARLTQIRKDIAAYNFCIAGRSSTIVPGTVLRSLAVQLGKNIPGYGLTLVNTIRPTYLSLNVKVDVEKMTGGQITGAVIRNLTIADPKQEIESLITAPLAALPAAGQPKVLMLDSLDEAFTYSPAENLVTLLAGLNNLPRWVRFLLTTRPVRHVLDHFVSKPTFVVDAGAQQNRADLRLYVHMRLDKPAMKERFLGSPKPVTPQALLERVAGAENEPGLAAGNFLYTKILLDDVERGVQPLADLEALPESLDEIYQRFLLRLASEWETRYQPLLAVLAAARVPLAFNQLVSFGDQAARLIGGKLNATVVNLALGVLVQFLDPQGKAGQERYALFHQSLRDYLNSPERSGQFACPPEDGNAAVAAYYLNQVAQVWSSCDEYGLRHLPAHLAAAGQLAELQRLLMEYTWLEAKLSGTDVYALLGDFALAPAGEPLQQVEAALRLAAHILFRTPDQLASQLLGRVPAESSAEIALLLEKIKKNRAGIWFRPLCPSLSQQGEALVGRLTGHTNYVSELVLNREGTVVVSGSGDGTLRVWDLANGAEQFTLKGHSKSISALAISPDGRTALSGSIDTQVRLWDLQLGKGRLLYSGHGSMITAVAITPDSRRAISADRDGNLAVLDLPEGLPVFAIKAHDRAATALVVSPDGRKFITASEDGTANVWELESGRLLHTLGTPGWRPGKTVTLADGRTGIQMDDDGVPALLDRRSFQVIERYVGHTEEITSLAVTPDSRRVITGSRDAALRVWDLETGAEQHILAGHEQYIYSVAVSPDGRLAASASSDRTVKVWDLATGACVHTLAGHKFDVYCLAFTPDGRGLVTGSQDETVRCWDIDRGIELACLRGHTEQVRALVVTPDGRRAISASNDRSLCIWDLSVKPAAVKSRHLAPVNSAAVARGGKLAVTVSGRQTSTAEDDNSLIVWDVPTGQARFVLAEHPSYVWSAAITPDGKKAVAGCGDGSLRVWDVEQGRLLYFLVGHSNHIWAVQVSPDGKKALSASGDRSLFVWDLELGQPLQHLTGHTDWVNRGVFLAGGKGAASSSNDGRVKIWDLERGTEIATLQGHAGKAYALAPHPDGRRLLSGGEDKTVRVWDLEKRREIQILQGHTGIVTAIAATSDGSRAVSASGFEDNTLRVWDLRRGEAIHVLRGHTAYISALALLPGDRRVISASLDGTLRLWDLSSGAELASFIGESQFRSFVLATQPDTGAATAIVGESSGRVHFLSLEGI